ncbi:cellulase family glycosylhydrolase [Sphingomonas sp. IW22]|uniref:cellulase family glycosylhydrolase n=1 Tax=Sphingomonas sp. IW22 TaxID=3242489 RepID=UPI003521B76B
MIHYLDAMLPDKDPDGIIELGKANRTKFGVDRLYLLGIVPDGLPETGKIAYATDPEERIPEPPVVEEPASEPVPITRRCMIGCNIGAGGMSSYRLDYGTAYFYPTAAELQLAWDNGIRLIRVPYRARRLMSDETTPGVFVVDPAVEKHLHPMMDAALDMGFTIIVEEHGYGASREARQKSPTTGNMFTPKLTVEKAAGLYESFMAGFGRYLNHPRLIPSFVNEPHSLGSDWWPIGREFVRLHRAAGWTTPLTMSISGYQAFQDLDDKIDDAKALADSDPLGRTIIDVHQYFDDDTSGRYPSQVMKLGDTYSDADVAEWIAKRLQPSVDAAREAGLTLALTEFAFPNNAKGRFAMPLFFKWLDDNADVIRYATWFIMSTFMPYDANGGGWYGLTQTTKTGASPLLKQIAALRK